MKIVNGTTIAAGFGAFALATLAYSFQTEPVAAEVVEPVQASSSSACDRAVWPYIPLECLRDERQFSSGDIRLAGS